MIFLLQSHGSRGWRRSLCAVGHVGEMVCVEVMIGQPRGELEVST